MSESIYLIYKLTSPSGKSYIGQTNNLSRRLSEHKSKRSACIALKHAIQKYGIDNFTVTILMEGLSIDEANKQEELSILSENTLSPIGYNLKSGGLNNTHSECTKEKMRQHSNRLGKLAYNNGVSPSPETRRKMSASHTGKIRGTHLEETKKKISASLINNRATCPHCGKTGGHSVMQRWHFDNCTQLNP